MADGKKIVVGFDDMPGRRPMDCVYDAKNKKYFEPDVFSLISTFPWKIRFAFYFKRRFSKIKTAIIDTGLLSRHPKLRGKIADSIDFTGEGTEDQNGHGTIVALLFLAKSSGVGKLLNVKVLDKDKVGIEEDLIMGLRWAETHGASLMNLSLGILRDCNGDCALCKEAERIASKGIVITAASGNEGLTCPARAKGVISVGISSTIRFRPVR